MRASVKRVFLHVSKWIGLFHVARCLTGHGLRIVCYHGIALGDESEFRPQLFIRPRTFSARLQYLASRRFPVLGLDHALDELDRGTLPRGATVITIDDGFYGVYKDALGLLQRFSFPATVYLTTYYCVKENPVFRLAVQYMFWKTDWQELDTTDLGCPGGGWVSLREREQRHRVMWDIITYGETQCEEVQRSSLTRVLGERLNVDYEGIVRGRWLSLVNSREIRELALSGMDIQLHTHRHRFPVEAESATREIADNVAALAPLVTKPLRHFCYPSGLWSEQHEAWLRAAGIRSATTCQAGLNYPNTPRFALKRFLDGEHIEQIEFEAEMCGYNELLRRGRAFLRRLPSRENASPDG